MTRISPYSSPPVSWHDGSLARQREDATLPVLRRAEIEAATCVVDVGCGAGQTLRIVEGLTDRATLIGVDPDAAALAAGRVSGGRILFLQGEGERLPIADGAASHVICRVAINYMQQTCALRELIRVLSPGGRLVVSCIGLGYSLRQVLLPARVGLRQRLGNVKDLIAGFAFQLTGYQASRGSFWGRSVPYTSLRWLKGQFQRSGCQLEWYRHESSFASTTTIWWIIARKDVILERQA
jgi:SAM-dependent methyltransferase